MGVQMHFVTTSNLGVRKLFFIAHTHLTEPYGAGTTNTDRCTAGLS